MRILLAFVLLVFSIAPSFAISVSWEIERGFRYFKYNSDFEFHRLAWRDYREKHPTPAKPPTVLQLDELISNPDWWSIDLGPKTAAWYGHSGSIDPVHLIREWRKREIAPAGDRHPGYLELADKIEAAGVKYAWEYHPARMGWASLLFPAHQKKGSNFQDSDLISSTKVATCWHRGDQRHTNCGDFDSYLNPLGHNVFLRAISDSDTRLLDGECLWTFSGGQGAKFVEPKDVTGSSVSVQCSSDVRLYIPNGKSIAVKLKKSDQESSATVLISDILVVGVGDSFASGEGNPDVPAKLRFISDPNSDWASDGGQITDEATNGPRRKRAGDYFAAQWIDRSCHRSAYSYQLRSAIQLALDDNSRAVTFVSYACSGAEVNEGLFQPYLGVEKTDSKWGREASEKAQFSLLLSEFCNLYDGSKVLTKPLSESAEEQAAKSNIDSKKYRLGGVVSDVAYRCAQQPPGKGFKRPIDLLYLSIGGNDLGFSRWILATMRDENFPTAFLPILKPDTAPECANHGDSCTTTRGRWARFNARYELLRDFIDHRLQFTNRGALPVLVMTYPLPVTYDATSYCPDGNAGMTVWTRSGLNMCVNGNQDGLPVLKTISEFTERRLNGSIESLAAGSNSRPAWTAISNYRDRFKGRGFCASRSKEEFADTRSIPREPVRGCVDGNGAFDQVTAAGKLSGQAVQETLYYPVGAGDSGFLPFEPVFDYLPYGHRTRLVRTMNETQILINQLNGETQAQNAAGILSLKDSAVFGAFHPIAEAHAIFADSFFEESKKILSRPRVIQ